MNAKPVSSENPLAKQSQKHSNGTVRRSLIRVATLQRHGPNILARFNAMNPDLVSARRSCSPDPGNPKASPAQTTFDAHHCSTLQLNPDLFKTGSRGRDINRVRPDVKQLSAEIQAPNPYRKPNVDPAFTRLFHMSSLETSQL